jgi:tetratricopeptide (TPR) repeat protein
MPKFRKTREHKGPNGDTDPVSEELRQVSNLIGRQQFEQALGALDQLASLNPTDKVRLSQIASLAADSQFGLARYQDAIECYKVASSHLADEKRIQYWIRPALGEVRALLKAIEVDQAYVKAKEIWSRTAESHQELEEELATTTEELQEQGSMQIDCRPVRPSVVLTRLGSVFLEEGYVDTAREFFQQAVLLSPRGATRARQGMAKVCQANSENSEAEKYARDALLMGKFQAKTVCSWEPLIAARAKQGKDLLDQELFTSLQLNQSGPVLARAILVIVKLLRSYGDERWKQIAFEWITREEVIDEVIEIEIAKILLSDEKLIGHDPRLIALAAHRIFRSDKVSPKEMVATAKDVTHMLLLDEDEPNVRALAEKAKRRFGAELKGEVLHAIALGAMMAKRHDLARELLVDRISVLPRGSKQWAMDISALARMEEVLENYTEAANHYLDFADTDGIQTDFRVQALLKWLNYIDAGGNSIDMEEVSVKLNRIIKGDLDFVVLLNIGRYLSYTASLKELCDQVILTSALKAQELFSAATTPEDAIYVLVRHTRKQYSDFRTYEAIISFWESLPAEKREWLWSEKAEYWEYFALLFQTYLELDQENQALQLASSIISSTSTPSNGRIWLGTAYANWQMSKGNKEEAFKHFDWLVKELPTHFNAAWGYYWKSVSALSSGNSALAKTYAAALRRCFAGRPDFSWQWKLDARALLIRSDLVVKETMAISQNYTQAYLEGELICLTDDLAACRI